MTHDSLADVAEGGHGGFVQGGIEVPVELIGNGNTDLGVTPAQLFEASLV